MPALRIRRRPQTAGSLCQPEQDAVLGRAGYLRNLGRQEHTTECCQALPALRVKRGVFCTWWAAQRHAEQTK